MWDFIIASSLPPYYSKLMCCAECTDVSSLKVVTKEYKIFHWATMKLVSGKCLWKPRKLRRLRFFTKTIQLPWLWATGRAYIHRFICLSSGSVECGHVAVLCPAPLTSCNQTLYLQWNEIWPLTTCHPRSQEDTPHHTQLSQGHCGRSR